MKIQTSQRISPKPRTIDQSSAIIGRTEWSFDTMFQFRGDVTFVELDWSYCHIHGTAQLQSDGIEMMNKFIVHII